MKIAEAKMRAEGKGYMVQRGNLHTTFIIRARFALKLGDPLEHASRDHGEGAHYRFAVSAHPL